METSLSEILSRPSNLVGGSFNPSNPPYSFPSHSIRRKVEGLRWAELGESPFGRQKGSSPSQKAGLQFERAFCKKLLKEIPGGFVSPWINFEDRNGVQGAMPDFVAPKEHILIECKLSNTPDAIGQLLDLYLPLCCHIWGRPSASISGSLWKCVIVCKFWRGASRPLIASIQEAKPGLNWMIA